MKHFKIITSILTVFLFLFSFANAVTIENPLGTTDVQTIIGNITRAALNIVGLIAVAMIVYAGILFSISGGNQDTLDKAKKTITYAIAGLVITLIARALVEFIWGAITGR